MVKCQFPVSFLTQFLLHTFMGILGMCSHRVADQCVHKCFFLLFTMPRGRRLPIFTNLASLMGMNCWIARDTLRKFVMWDNCAQISLISNTKSIMSCEHLLLTTEKHTNIRQKFRLVKSTFISVSSRVLTVIHHHIPATTHDNRLNSQMFVQPFYFSITRRDAVRSRLGIVRCRNIQGLHTCDLVRF